MFSCFENLTNEIFRVTGTRRSNKCFQIVIGCFSNRLIIQYNIYFISFSAFFQKEKKELKFPVVFGASQSLLSHIPL